MEADRCGVLRAVERDRELRFVSPSHAARRRISWSSGRSCFSAATTSGSSERSARRRRELAQSRPERQRAAAASAAGSRARARRSRRATGARTPPPDVAEPPPRDRERGGDDVLRVRPLVAAPQRVREDVPVVVGQEPLEVLLHGPHSEPMSGLGGSFRAAQAARSTRARRAAEDEHPDRGEDHGARGDLPRRRPSRRRRASRGRRRSPG